MEFGLNLFSLRNLIRTEEAFLDTAIKLREMGYSFLQYSGGPFNADMIARVSQKSGMPKEPTSLSETVGTIDIVARDIDDDFIKSRIFTVRGVQVMFDSDLAVFYGVPTKRPRPSVYPRCPPGPG